MLTNLRALVDNLNDPTPPWETHAADLNLMQQYGVISGRVVIVSLREQTARVLRERQAGLLGLRNHWSTGSALASWSALRHRPRIPHFVQVGRSARLGALVRAHASQLCHPLRCRRIFPSRCLVALQVWTRLQPASLGSTGLQRRVAWLREFSRRPDGPGLLLGPERRTHHPVLA